MSTDDWTHVHRRHDLVEDYLAHEGRGVTPRLASLLEQEFPEHEDLLRALHLRWVTVLNACIEQQLETGDGNPAETFRAAWQDAVDRAPRLRRVLDREGGDPVLRRLEDAELARAAQACGLWAAHTTAAELVASARSASADIAPRVGPRRRGSLGRWWGTRRAHPLRVTSDGYPAPAGR